MTSTTLLRAVRQPGFLASAWPWRAFLYAGGTAVVAGLLWVLLAVPLAPLALAVRLVAAGRVGVTGSSWRHLLVVVGLGLVGLVLLAAVGPPLAVAVARVERWRLRLVDAAPAVAPPGRSRPHTAAANGSPAAASGQHPRTPPASAAHTAAAGRGARLHTDPATWRAVAYLPLLGLVAPVWLAVLGALALLVGSTPVAMLHRLAVPNGSHSAVERVVLGLALAPVLVYLTAGFGGAHAALARLLLCAEPAPPADGAAAAELVEVGRSRARLVDAFDAERLRIERDLHDVAQQRLVSLTMQLGLARYDLPADSPASAAVTAAHEQAKTLMVELRGLVHGISPRTLRELGLQAAVEELAAGSPVRVTLDAGSGRFAPPVERVAFAAVAEALSNVVKHAGATAAAVTVRQAGNRLAIEVRDDGRGGADPAGGSGLTGLADRAAAAGGRLLLSSPPGGPTVLRVELPCPT